MTRYCQVVNYSLSIYAPGDVITDVGEDLTTFKQPEIFSAVRYSEVLRENALHCGLLQDESKLRGAFIGQIHESMHLSMIT